MFKTIYKSTENPKLGKSYPEGYLEIFTAPNLHVLVVCPELVEIVPTHSK